MKIKVICLVLAILTGGIVLSRFTVYSRTEQRGDENEPALSRAATPVVVIPVSTRPFSERLVLQGNIEAMDYANVSPRIAGTIETLFVEEGDAVIAGRTRLFQIDSIKLQQAVQIRRQDLAVARLSRREQAARLEQVEAELHKVALDLKRYQGLHAAGAVSADILEQWQSRHLQSVAMRKHAASLVDLRMEQVRQAEVALAVAQKDLSDALVLAPIDGIVSQKFKEPGEMGAVGLPVVRIENTRRVQASAFLPAPYYDRVVVQRTGVDLSVAGQAIGRQTVSYRSPTIDPKLRTFEIKVHLTDPPAGVVPGALVALSLVLAERDALGVPSHALQIRGDRSVVFVASDETARMVVVRPGLETDGYTEITGGVLAEGDRLVTQGQAFLNDGDTLTVRQEAG